MTLINFDYHIQRMIMSTIYICFGLLMTRLCLLDQVHCLGMTVIEGDVYIELITSIYTNSHENGTCYDIDRESMQNVESIRWTLMQLNQGPSKEGKGIGLRVSATCRLADKAEKLAFQLVNEMSSSDHLDVIGVLGGDNSDEALSIARLLNVIPARYRLPVVSYRATASSLNDDNLSNFIRVIPSDIIQTEIMLKFMKSLNWTYLAVVHTNDTYGRDGNKALHERIKGTDICFPVSICFDRTIHTEKWLEIELNDNVHNAPVPIGGIIVFGGAELQNTLLRVTENIQQRYSNMSYPAMLFSAGGIAIIDNTTYGRFGTFSLSPPRRNISEFQEHLQKIFINLNTTLNNLPQTYVKWMKALYLSYFNCQLPTRIDDNQYPAITTTNATITSSIYNQYAIQAALTLASIEQKVRKKWCQPGKFCSLFNISRNEYAKHTRRLTVHIDGFNGVQIKAFTSLSTRFIIEFSDSCEPNLPEHYPKYEVYQDQLYDSHFNRTKQVKVAYLADKMVLRKESIKDYNEYGNESNWPNIRKPQCPNNFSCPLCLNKTQYPSIQMLEPGEMYVVGIVPIHNRGDSPLECGQLKSGMLDVVEAMRFAIREAGLKFENKIPKAKLGLIVIDSCNDGHIIQEKMINLHRKGYFKNSRYLPISGRILGYIGGFSSDSSSIMADICARLGCVQISYASTALSLSSRTTYPNFLRIPGSDIQQAEAILNIVKEIGSDVIQVVHSDTVYGNNGRQALQEKAHTMNVCISKIHKYSSRNSANLFDEIRRVKNVKTIVLYLTSFDVSEIKTYINDSVYEGEFVFVCSDGWGKRGDISNVNGMIGSITLTPELPISDKFEEHMKQLNPEQTDVNPWARPYMEDFFNCYYQWNYNKTSGHECTGKESLDVYTTAYKIDVWSPFAEKATLSLLLGARAALDQLCGNPNQLCDDYTKHTDVVVAEAKKTKFKDTSGNMARVFDDNGDGLVGYTFYAVVAEEGTVKYKHIGSSMPIFVFDKDEYKTLGIEGSICIGQEACNSCTAHGDSTLTTAYPTWLVVMSILLLLTCSVVVGYLLYTIYRRGCCIYIENGWPRPVAGYLAHADLVNTRQESARQMVVESGYYMSLSECLENEYDHAERIENTKGKLDPVFDNRPEKPIDEKQPQSKIISFEVPFGAAIPLPRKSKIRSSTLEVCIEAPQQSEQECNEAIVESQEFCDKVLASTLAHDTGDSTHDSKNGVQQVVTSPENCGEPDKRGSSENNEVFMSLTQQNRTRQPSNSSYVLGNIPASVSSYAQISEYGEDEIDSR